MTTDCYKGQCLCGRIQVAASGRPVFSVLCHCLDCQQISGAGGFPQAAFLKERVDIKGALKTFSWVSDAGNDLRLCHCPDCGSPIYKATSKIADILFIAVGLLDDQTLFQTPHHAFAENRPDWDRRD